ncbi:unnamed protein product, partial [Symbiodinium necroappetens]
LLRAMLEAAGDPDRDFLRQAEDGLPVGILDPLPRTPHVFAEQVKWPLDNSFWEASLAWAPNYSSVAEHADFARAKFEEMCMGEFLERYGEHTAIAALAVIVEDEETGSSAGTSYEHGYLACQVDTKEEVPGDPASQTVYVNLVGTFGLSCGIAACGLRLTYHLLGPDFPLDLLLYADDLEAMGKGPRQRRGIP